MSEIPIKNMTVNELQEFARDLYKDGYSRITIYQLTDGRISERQIRKIYKDAQKKPLLKAWHEENMTAKKDAIRKAVNGRINALKLQGKKVSKEDRKRIEAEFRKQSFKGMYKRNHPNARRYIGKEGTFRDYLEIEA
jgi:hypothetical protein